MDIWWEWNENIRKPGSSVRPFLAFVCREQMQARTHRAEAVLVKGTWGEWIAVKLDWRVEPLNSSKSVWRRKCCSSWPFMMDSKQTLILWVFLAAPHGRPDMWCELVWKPAMGRGATDQDQCWMAMGPIGGILQTLCLVRPVAECTWGQQMQEDKQLKLARTISLCPKGDQPAVS